MDKRQHHINAEKRAKGPFILIEQDEYGTYVVMNVDNERFHFVDTDEMGRIFQCSCEHFTYRGPIVCKHMSYLQNCYGFKLDISLINEAFK